MCFELFCLDLLPFHVGRFIYCRNCKIARVKHLIAITESVSLQ